MIRVSSPQRTSGCASSITRRSVVPLRGTPPTNMRGESRVTVRLCRIAAAAAASSALAARG